MIFSKIFDITGSNDIGLSLFNIAVSSFLCIGITFANLSLLGNMPVLNNWLMISVSAGKSLIVMVFSSLFDI